MARLGEPLVLAPVRLGLLGALPRLGFDLLDRLSCVTCGLGRDADSRPRPRRDAAVRQELRAPRLLAAQPVGQLERLDRRLEMRLRLVHGRDHPLAESLLRLGRDGDSFEEKTGAHVNEQRAEDLAFMPQLSDLLLDFSAVEEGSFEPASSVFASAASSALACSSFAVASISSSVFAVKFFARLRWRLAAAASPGIAARSVGGIGSVNAAGLGTRPRWSKVGVVASAMPPMPAPPFSIVVAP